eukprot:6393617-Pyramimonas_sp.AAC.1
MRTARGHPFLPIDFQRDISAIGACSNTKIAGQWQRMAETGPQWPMLRRSGSAAVTNLGDRWSLQQGDSWDMAENILSYLC